MFPNHKSTFFKMNTGVNMCYHRHMSACVFVFHPLCLQVEVETDCIDVSPNQQVQVTMKTVPSYCGISWASTYHTPGKSKCMIKHTHTLSGGIVIDVREVLSCLDAVFLLSSTGCTHKDLRRHVPECISMYLNNTTQQIVQWYKSVSDLNSVFLIKPLQSVLPSGHFTYVFQLVGCHMKYIQKERSWVSMCQTC